MGRLLPIFELIDLPLVTLKKTTIHWGFNVLLRGVHVGAYGRLLEATCVNLHGHTTAGRVIRSRISRLIDLHLRTCLGFTGEVGIFRCTRRRCRGVLMTIGALRMDLTSFHFTACLGGLLFIRWLWRLAVSQLSNGVAVFTRNCVFFHGAGVAGETSAS